MVEFEHGFSCFGDKKVLMQISRVLKKHATPTTLLAMVIFVMEGNIILDDAKISDIAQMAALIGLLFEFEGEFSPNREKQERALRLILEQPHIGRLFVARKGEEIVGMVSLLFTVSTYTGGPAVILEDMVVPEPFRKMGIGTMLLKHVIAFAARNGYSRITLLTDRVNEAARRFYERHGFTLSEMAPMRLTLARD